MDILDDHNVEYMDQKGGKNKCLSDVKLFCRLICGSFKTYKNKTMIELCYESVQCYMDMLRLLKLYTDVEYIKKEALDLGAAEFLDQNEKFMLNPKNIIKIITEN